MSVVSQGAPSQPSQALYHPPCFASCWLRPELTFPLRPVLRPDGFSDAQRAYPLPPDHWASPSLTRKPPDFQDSGIWKMRMLLAVANICQVPTMQLTLREGLVYVPELNSHNN